MESSTKRLKNVHRQTPRVGRLVVKRNNSSQSPPKDISEQINEKLYRFANYVKRHQKTGLGHPLDNQAVIKDEIVELFQKSIQEARKNEVRKFHKLEIGTDKNMYCRFRLKELEKGDK